MGSINREAGSPFRTPATSVMYHRFPGIQPLSVMPKVLHALIEFSGGIEETEERPTPVRAVPGPGSD